MPVFAKLKGEILVVTVDGDCTAGEVRRVGERWIRDPGTPRPARVLLDVTGAAARGGEGSQALREGAASLGALAPDLGWLAVLAPEGLRGEFTGETVFSSRAEASSWLESQGGAE